MKEVNNDRGARTQDGPNWGLIILVIVMLGMWTGAMVSAYTEWSAA